LVNWIHVKITKLIRSLNNTTLKASEAYHTMLLNTKINIYYDSYYFSISNDNDENLQQIVKNNHDYLNQINNPYSSNDFIEPTGFKTNIKTLYEKVFHASPTKKIVTETFSNGMMTLALLIANQLSK